MKLVIQIPCLNEEKTLPQTVRDLPKSIPGIDQIEILVVDDGSTDRTVAVAEALGVHHILRLGRHRGLARAFTMGLEEALALGANIIVNTDGDNQYAGADIPKLVKPILEGRADMVVGCRPIAEHREFSPLKKMLQHVGSWTLRGLSQTTVRDAASGFRALSRETAQRLFIHSRFSHCMETLIQAGNLRLRVNSVEVNVNPKTRRSRLYRSLPEYLWKSGGTMLTMFVHYRPSRFFGALAAANLAGAILLGLRFLYLVYLVPQSVPRRTYIPSLILLAILALVGVGLMALALIAELIRSNRRLVEEMLFLLRKQLDEKTLSSEGTVTDKNFSGEPSRGCDAAKNKDPAKDQGV
jgi:glycosyltransferase involved in cell wall biosynthesis